MFFFLKKVARLEVVRETKQKVANGLFDEVDLNLEDVDLYSDISAAASSHIKVFGIFIIRGSSRLRAGFSSRQPGFDSCLG